VKRGATDAESPCPLRHFGIAVSSDEQRLDRLEPSDRLYSAPLGKNFRMNVVALSVDDRFGKCKFCDGRLLSCVCCGAFEPKACRTDSSGNAPVRTFEAYDCAPI
jgi:hypothetical protein